MDEKTKNSYTYKEVFVENLLFRIFFGYNSVPNANNNYSP